MRLVLGLLSESGDGKPQKRSFRIHNFINDDAVIPHRRLFSPSDGQNSQRTGKNIIAFYARRGIQWYYTEVGIFENIGKSVFILEEVKVLNKDLREEYNRIRPYSAPGDRPPAP